MFGGKKRTFRDQRRIPEINVGYWPPTTKRKPIHVGLQRLEPITICRRKPETPSLRSVPANQPSKVIRLIAWRRQLGDTRVRQQHLGNIRLPLVQDQNFLLISIGPALSLVSRKNFLTPAAPVVPKNNRKEGGMQSQKAGQSPDDRECCTRPGARCRSMPRCRLGDSLFLTHGVETENVEIDKQQLCRPGGLNDGGSLGDCGAGCQSRTDDLPLTLPLRLSPP